MSKEIQIKLAQNTAIFCAGLAIIVCLLLLLNYFQISSNDPLESESIELLLDRLEENPQDEGLKSEIRNFDLLARKAYFNSQWQIQTGAFILLFTCILMIIAYRYYLSLTAKISIPLINDDNAETERMSSLRWIVVAGSIIICFALFAAFKSNQYLDKYKSTSDPERMINNAGAEEIEIIEITEVAELPSDDRNTEVTPENSEEILNQEALTEQKEILEKPDQIQKKTAVEKQKEIIPQQSKTDVPISKQDTVSEAPKKAELVFPSAATIKQNHNAFRAAFGNGISIHKNIPTSWNASTGDNIQWKIKNPKNGKNSPVIWGDKLFIAGGDKTSRLVFCLDRHSGKMIWQKEVNNIDGSPGQVPKTTDDTGLSAPTITTDGIGVYAIFGTGDLIAFDINGNRLWAKNLGVPDNHYGHSSSLLSWKEKLFVQYDTNKGGKVLALDVRTGEIIWSTKRKSKISWASPILQQINGSYQLVLVSAPEVAGYSINDGKEIWSLDCLMGEVGASAAFGEGLIFASNEYATLVAINPLKNYQIEWESDEYLPEVSSPVVSKGLLFIATSYGVLVCYDAKSGEKYWEYEPGEGFYSSPMVAEDKLYITDMGGTTYIVKVEKEFILISKSTLGEEVVSTPAFANGRIYIRGKNHLYCIGE
jgi:outer membrane protein assembly factor BamB